MLTLNYNGSKLSVETNTVANKAATKPLIVKSRDSVLLGELVVAAGLDATRIFKGPSGFRSMVYVSQDEAGKILANLAGKIPDLNAPSQVPVSDDQDLDDGEDDELSDA